jgi:hypothetical protein
VKRIRGEGEVDDKDLSDPTVQGGGIDGRGSADIPKMLRGVQAQGANGVEALQHAGASPHLIEEAKLAIETCAQEVMFMDLSGNVVEIMVVRDLVRLEVY